MLVASSGESETQWSRLLRFPSLTYTKLGELEVLTHINTIDVSSAAAHDRVDTQSFAGRSTVYPSDHVLAVKPDSCPYGSIFLEERARYGKAYTELGVIYGFDVLRDRLRAGFWIWVVVFLQRLGIHSNLYLKAWKVRMNCHCVVEERRVARTNMQGHLEWYLYDLRLLLEVNA